MRAVLPLLFVLCGLSPISAQESQEYRVGVARVDITPTYPVRLSGFGFRRTESEGVTQKIYARALVLVDPEPAALLTVDSIGIPLHLRNKLAERLAHKIGLKPERLAVCATHTHTAPMVGGNLTTLFGVPVPPEHQQRIDRYTAELLDAMEKAVLEAHRNIQPARLSFGLGQARFANNRRTQGGPVDHDVPLLAVKSPQGKLRAVLVNYACHCTTLSFNQITGDWAGYAAEMLEADHPDTVALVAIGCGADANPIRGVTRDRVDLAQGHGRELAVEARRLLAGFLKPVTGKLTAKQETLTLPLDTLPTKEEWELRSQRKDAIGYHAQMQLARLARGEKLQTQIDYSVQTWAFGDSLAMVFLPGEVVVDYALRLKKELDPHRVWVNAYVNDVPCYIPSERILKEGGYEGGGAMTYYDLPARLKPGLEQPIIDAVHRQIGSTFKAPFDANKIGGTRPLSPQQSMATFQTRFQVDLVAAEPLVTSPVAIDWGPDGRLYVAEMYDYPQGTDGKYQPGGRVRLLTSSRHDGNYDRSVVFLEKIPFPTGVTAYRNGILVCAAPDILYAEDTDGDGKADVVKKLYSGFGTENYQGRVNSIRWGLDNWWYGSCGLFGGQIACSPLNVGWAPPTTSPGGQSPPYKNVPSSTAPRSGISGRGGIVSLGNRDFRLRPDLGLLEPATGRTQQGRCRDDWGSWFGCDNSSLGWHYPLPDHYLRRNPHVTAPPAAVPLVPWTAQERLYPIAKNLQLFALSGPSGRPTAACGLEIYRDDLLGESYKGNSFICEPVNLLIHRRILQPAGSSFKGVRAPEEQDREFLAATDPWFRPVQVRTGPDGALWVVDMYRHVIEHPIWIPPGELAKLDLRAGSTMGRIYRIYPKEKPPRPMPRLDKLDTAGLVAALDSPNGWQRDMASQMLLWKKDDTAVSLLEKMTENNRPEARLHALCVLEGLGKLRPQIVEISLKDRHPGVRRNVIRLTEPFLKEERFREQTNARFTSLMHDTGAQVRLQVAFSLGHLPNVNSSELGSWCFKHRQDHYFVAAILSGVNEDTLSGMLMYIHQPFMDDAAKALTHQLFSLAAKAGNLRPVHLLLENILDAENGASVWRMTTLTQLLEACEHSPKQFAFPNDKTEIRALRLVAQARQLALNGSTPHADRLAAVLLLGRLHGCAQQDQNTLAKLLVPQTPDALQAATLTALGRSKIDNAAMVIVDRWMQLSPTLKTQALDILLSRPKWHWTLLDGIESKQIPAGMIDAARRQRLLQNGDKELRTAAQKVFAATTGSRAQVLKEYQTVLSLQGDKERGKAVFHKQCANCHKVQEVGHTVGPDLMALGNRTPEYLLAEVLDPNRTIDSRYVEYVALTKAGLVHNGILASESSTSITLRGQEGKEQVLLRNELEELRSTGKSLMPEGLEKDLPKQDMADLLAYLASTGRPPKQFTGNTPAPVKTANGVYALLATNGEIHGNQICFEAPLQNIGYWHDMTDHVAWTVQVEKTGIYDVWLDWACAPDSAGNAFVLEGGPPGTLFQVASTGGWDRYQQQKLISMPLEAGQRRLVVRPAGPQMRGALMDLRGIYLVPAGTVPPLARVVSPDNDDPRVVAQQLLDDKVPGDRKNALVQKHLGRAAEIIAAMTADLKDDSKEEYRRIPWIWRVAIAAGRQNQTEPLRKLLDASLPMKDAPLCDWQAVVIGGGIINGLSQNGQWPHQRLLELFHMSPALQARYHRSLELAAVMADNEKVPTGTRYDALRMIALDSWAKRGPQLTKYLAKGTHDELQMGAISGLSDVDDPAVVGLLLGGLGHYSPGNRKLALEALLRNDTRLDALLTALEQGQVKKEWLDDGLKKKLRELPQEKHRERVKKLLGPGPG